MSETNGETNTGHGSNGRFVAGNKGNPKAKGRPPRDGKRYQAILQSALTPRKWQAIIHRAINDAINGDEKVVHHARTFIANYCIGKPEQVLKLASDAGERLRVEFVKDWTPGIVPESQNADDSSPGPA